MGSRATGRRLRLLGTGVAAVAALVACSQQACETAGCTGTISVDLSGVAEDLGSAHQATVCVGTASLCLDATLTAGRPVARVTLPDGSIPGPGIDPDDPVPVRIQVDGTSVDAGGTVTLSSFSPNGVKCGPTCYAATLRATDDTTLRAVTPSGSP